jgi:hypothetical protein
MRELADNICLGRFYPREGVPGVLSLPVEDEGAIARYRAAASIKPIEDVRFFRLTMVPDKASGWLLPGDVLCVYEEFEEALFDLIRPNATSTYIWNNKWSKIDEDELEKVRAEAIEDHRWTFSRTDTQLTTVDPYGRASVIRVQSKRLTRLFTSFSSVVPRTKHEIQCHLRLSPEVQHAGEFVLRLFHGQMLKAGPEVDGMLYTKFRRTAQAMYDQAYRCAHLSPDVDCLRIHFSNYIDKRKPCWDFIDLCKSVYAGDQKALPRPLRLMAGKHYHIKWVRLSPKEWEDCLVFWFERHDGNWNDPFGMSTIDLSDVGYKRWAYKN